jgi:hypothetical protein
MRRFLIISHVYGQSCYAFCSLFLQFTCQKAFAVAAFLCYSYVVLPSFLSIDETTGENVLLFFQKIFKHNILEFA